MYGPKKTQKKKKKKKRKKERNLNMLYLWELSSLNHTASETTINIPTSILEIFH